MIYGALDGVGARGWFTVDDYSVSFQKDVFMKVCCVLFFLDAGYR